MFQYHAETAFSLQLFSSNHQIHIILFLYRILLRIFAFFTHWSVYAALQSPTVVYLRVCSSCSGRGRRRRPRRPRIVRWRRLLSLSQNVPLHTPPPPPWSSRPYLSEKKVLFHRGVQYLKYKMKRMQKCYSTVRKSQLYYWKCKYLLAH